MTTPTTELHPATVERVAQAAEAALALVPAAVALTGATPVDAAALDASSWAAGAVADLNAGGPGAQVAVLVGPELVDALASAPGGALDLGAALQPALDAAAAALGCAAGAARTLAPEDLGSVLKAGDVAVPLESDGVPAAVVVATLGSNVSGAGAPVVAGVTAARGVELLHGVAMEVTVELGRTRLSVRDLLALSPGDVIELDRAAGSPADLLVNGRLIARGEVVVLDENFALRVTEIVAQSAAV